MKKKTLVLCVALVLILVLVGGTISNITRTGTAKSVVTASNVKIKLVMSEKDASGNIKEASAKTEIAPGEAVSRIAAARNTGDQTVWVRAVLPMDTAGCEYSGIGNEWEYKDGYWYYGKALAPGETTSPLFEEVHFSDGVDKDIEGNTVNLDVKVQATQQVHNGSSALEAQGWPEK